ncbi:hypothetical protein V1260_09810 [Brachybacterium sp. J144]|uniref:hypothetical protein n=1 Tax=Brachybacterium sp. J144 TaxID=3116487 RepID=UPI002E77EEF5|nr:hypothetical protein [Brachybacterium sp. J144]MEE1651081.1 hypothetical protein [Brachybacterium sp. J144]
MHDYDEDRFAAGAPSLSGPRGSGWSADGDRTRPSAGRHARSETTLVERPRILHADGDVVVEQVAQQGREGVVRVRALSGDGRRAVRDQAQLLAALEVDALRAAPMVLALEDDAYLRESAPELARRGGRRADHDGTPPTAERLALGVVREDLEALVGALHERGWLLGARGASALGLRADGTVVLLDLRGLRRGDDALDQLADRHWIDATLLDRDRTLRRRIDGHRAVQQAPVAVGDGPAGTTEPVRQWPAVPAEEIEHGDRPAGAEGQAEHRAGPRPAPRAAEVDSPRSSRSNWSTRWGNRGTQSTRGARSTPVAHLVRSVHPLIVDPGTRRIALLSGASVLAAGLVLGTGGWLLSDGPRGEGSASEVGTGETTGESGTEGTGAGPDSGAGTAADPIEDPWSLGAELAGSRHAYLTSASDQAPTAAGSAARAEDDAVRAAYEGATVRGGGPVVQDAELLEIDLDAGTAALRLETSTEAATITDAAGEATEVPATAPGTVILDLAWDGRQWLITEVREPDA